MKLLRVVALLAVAALSLAMLPSVQALPYLGIHWPDAPPAPPIPPPAPPTPARASMYVVAPPAPPVPPTPPEPWTYERGDDGDKYVLSAGDMNVVNGDGDTDMEDMRRAYGRHFFWFRHDGHAYV